jgi:hypothetical protein
MIPAGTITTIMTMRLPVPLPLSAPRKISAQKVMMVLTITWLHVASAKEDDFEILCVYDVCSSGLHKD